MIEFECWKESMAQIIVILVLIGTVVIKYEKNVANATPQLDLPENNSNITNIRKISFENANRVRTNGHSEKIADLAISGDQSNEVGIGDTQNYDRDRSLRYGPPYSDENDRRFYNNDNSNYNSRYNNRNVNNHDDDRYYTQPRPNDDYYISEKERANRYGYRDYYSIVR